MKILSLLLLSYLSKSVLAWQEATYYVSQSDNSNCTSEDVYYIKDTIHLFLYTRVDPNIVIQENGGFLLDGYDVGFAKNPCPSPDYCKLNKNQCLLIGCPISGRRRNLGSYCFWCKTTPKPSPRPTKKPTRKPTSRPTKKPTSKPTRKPTRKPTSMPTKKPTSAPVPPPVSSPVVSPVAAPVSSPVSAPVAAPVATPTSTFTAALLTDPAQIASEGTYWLRTYLYTPNALCIPSELSFYFELVV